MRIEYATLALDRILEIAERRFPDASDRAQAWMSDVVDHVAQLGAFPRMGPQIRSARAPRADRHDVRRLLFADVWVVYEVREANPASVHEHADDHILVLTVRHVREEPLGD